MKDTFKEYCVWRIDKYHSGDYERGAPPFDTVEIEGNLLLNEGINELLLRAMGNPSGDPWDNSHAYIGVGDSTTAAAATQTGLQATTNKAWKGMESGYPIAGTDQAIVFRSVFSDSEANFAWNEFTVGNSNDDSGENLNRKVQAIGTKPSNQTWTITVTITLS